MSLVSFGLWSLSLSMLVVCGQLLIGLRGAPGPEDPVEVAPPPV